MEERTDDWALLDAYARNGSHEAFGRVVGRYADFVFATARRRVRDRQLAEDVTQSVFIVLARRAAGLRAGGSLGAWLHRTTLLASKNALRAENRRRRREKDAIDLAVNSQQDDFVSNHVATDLDGALEKIGRADRDVLALHYLEGRPVLETAEILGITGEAAKKRLSRAMARLRQILARQGVALPAAGISNGLIAIGKPSAAASAAVAANVVAGGGRGNAFTLSRNVIHVMKIMMIQKIAAAAMIVLLVGGATVGIVAGSSGKNPPKNSQAAATQPAIQNAVQPVYLDVKTGPTPVVVTITDGETRSPIAGATITKLVPIGTMLDGDCWETRQEVVGTTDEKGTISLQCDPAQRTAFLVTAVGWTPDTFGFWGCVPENYRFDLAKQTGTMSGLIVDADGKPMVGIPVRVRPLEYGLVQALQPSEVNPIYTCTFDCKTDDKGRFSIPGLDHYDGWVEIQENGTWYSASRQDNYSQTEAVLRDGTFVGRPRMDAPVIVADLVPSTQPSAGPNLTIHMHAVDADTGQPIHNVHVTPGGTAPGRFVQTLAGQAVDLPAGEVTWSFYDDATNYWLRVEADGYAVTPTRIVEAAEKDADVEVKMSKATKAQVTVLTPDGRPAAGAKAYLATPTISLDVPPSDTGLHESFVKPIGVAGEDGVIHYTPPGEDYRLAISSPDGWAEVAPASDQEAVTLTAWATTEFDIQCAGKPLPRAIVGIQSGFSEGLKCWINWEDNYVVDKNGHVVLPTCRPGMGDYYIGAPIDADVGWVSVQINKPLKAGQHVSYSLMTGKTTIKGILIPPQNYKWSKNLNIRPDGPAAELPEGVNLQPRRALMEAVKVAQRSAPDKKAAETVIQFINFNSNADGTFSVSGLRPGMYEMTGWADEKTKAANLPVVAGGDRPEIHWFFSVPANAPETIDLGEISMSMTAK